MIRRSIRRLSISLLALGALWPVSAVAQSSSENFVGVNVHIPSNDMLDAVADLGLKWIRIDVNWQDIQPDENVPPNYAVHDRVVDEALKRGLKVFATLAYFPRWATEPGADEHHHNDVPRPGLYERVAKEAATHFAGRIGYWGLWNETNLSHFFEGTRQQWLERVVAEGVRGFRAGCPSCKVVGPELAGLDKYHEWMDAFLSHLAAANLSVDVLSWHNYGNFEEINPVYVCATGHYFKHLMDEQRNCFGVPTGSPPMRPVIERHGLGHLPVWISETGYKAARDEQARLAKQVTYYRRVLEEQVKRPWFSGSFFYELVDDNSAEVPKWGMATRSDGAASYPASYQKKPVWDFIEKAVTSPAFGGSGSLCDDGLDTNGDQVIDDPAECVAAPDLGPGVDSGVPVDAGIALDLHVWPDAGAAAQDASIAVVEGGVPPSGQQDLGAFNGGSGSGCALGGTSGNILPLILFLFWGRSRRRKGKKSTV